jgi:hypothetical protein
MRLVQAGGRLVDHVIRASIFAELKMLLVYSVSFSLGQGSLVPTSACPKVATSIPVNSVCESFCSGRCAFYNNTFDDSDTGYATNVTLYRVTPYGAVSLANKNTGDAMGDLLFYFYQVAGSGVHVGLQKTYHFLSSVFPSQVVDF